MKKDLNVSQFSTATFKVRKIESVSEETMNMRVNFYHKSIVDENNEGSVRLTIPIDYLEEIEEIAIDQLIECYFEAGPLLTTRSYPCQVINKLMGIQLQD
ncbi:hypothetical protein AB6887_06975 [Carnobacterium divergens]|uniref:Uncharacterized protein n=1 Tax=Carnobacterium divergens TaxID=2748 RepID=A0A7Z8CYY5_CARDV|nr:hypothetical protein [Carnobacterium divergens]MPQ21295.1 hypothetical protein [Carnobacterium divergens]TFI71342.1 hypothetical protein CKN58_09870 [Carnobacterium divergens]TFI75984.1 hypothetical protein CKN85_09925 [Carnobacterium divergens]TFI81856.1 hypothetical protein CKN56_09950 [Carnobacterium divergens]TFI94165.1 hypothetical protein CKN64_09890 [Carnobacterium divergens]